MTRRKYLFRIHCRCYRNTKYNTKTKGGESFRNWRCITGADAKLLSGGTRYGNVPRQMYQLQLLLSHRSRCKKTIRQDYMPRAGVVLLHRRGRRLAEEGLWRDNQFRRQIYHHRWFRAGVVHFSRCDERELQRKGGLYRGNNAPTFTTRENLSSYWTDFVQASSQYILDENICIGFPLVFTPENIFVSSSVLASIPSGVCAIRKFVRRDSHSDTLPSVDNKEEEMIHHDATIWRILANCRSWKSIDVFEADFDILCYFLTVLVLRSHRYIVTRIQAIL
jgi:hypothetical protein